MWVSSILISDVGFANSFSFLDFGSLTAPSRNLLMNTQKLEAKKLKNRRQILGLMPLELWRLVDDFADAKSHTLLRASCSFFRRWLPGEKNVDFEEYKILFEGLRHYAWTYEGRAFQSAINLNLHSVKWQHYEYLCRMKLYLAVLRVCRFALHDPFSFAHIDLSACSDYAIRVASKYGQTEVVQYLLQVPRVDPSAWSNYAIQSASQNGHLDVVQLLLQDPRVDPSADDNAAIRWASYHGQTLVVQLLLHDPRVDPAAQDNSAVRYASRKGHLDVVLLLLQDKRVNPSANESVAFRDASMNGHISEVQLLLQDPRVDPSARNNQALREAVTSENNSKDICDLLLSNARVVAAYLLDPFDLPSDVIVPPREN